VVGKRCLGKPTCSVLVDFDVFGDPCEGKKTLAVQVGCQPAPNQEATGTASHVAAPRSRTDASTRASSIRAKPLELTPYSSLRTLELRAGRVDRAGTGLTYRHMVQIPVGVSADVVVPLLGKPATGATSVTVTESGVVVWKAGKFVGDGASPGVKAGAVDEQMAGIRFAVVQGSYTFEW
jgi:hypothetical protein